MTARLATVRTTLGHKNAWQAGPSVDWPLLVLVIDECQTFLDAAAAKGDKDREPKVRRMIALVASLIRKGRSAMMLTIVATQKPTTDSLPSSIRDNCPLSLCFGVKTTDAAAATVGSSIRDYPSYSPLSLADPVYAGCCTVTLRTGADPFTRLCAARGSVRTRPPRSRRLTRACAVPWPHRCWSPTTPRARAVTGSDDDLTSYSLEVERLELVLDNALADIRRKQVDGTFIPLEAALERSKVLREHLAARKRLSDAFWGPAR